MTVSFLRSFAQTSAYSNVSANSNVAFLSDSPTVTFGVAGNVITASAVGGAAAGLGALSAGTQTITSGTVVFSNSNGVSFGVNGQTVTASFSGGAGGGPGISAGTESVATGTVVWSNSNGLTFGMSGSSRITASMDAVRSLSAGTTHALGGGVSFGNGSGVSFGVNGSTLTASVAAGATATGNLGALAGGTQTATSGTVVFSDSNGVSFGLSGSTRMTASVGAGATATGNFGALAAGTQTATSGTVVLSDSNGLTFGMSGSTRITGSHDGVRSISGGTTRATGGEVVFSNANGVTFGVNGQTVTASVSPGGGGATLSSYEPYQFRGTGTASISASSQTSAGQLLVPFTIDTPVAVEAVAIVAQMTFTTGGASSFRQSGTLNWGIYTRPSGTNGSQLRNYTSNSLTYAVTYNNSSITINQPTTTAGSTYTYADTSSAGLNISSGYTGSKLMLLGLATTLTQGQYWLGLHHRQSSSSFNSGIRISFVGTAASQSALAPMGSFSSAYTTGSAASLAIGGNWMPFLGSYTVAGQTALTATVSVSQISGNLTVVPYFSFLSRVLT